VFRCLSTVPSALSVSEYSYSLCFPGITPVLGSASSGQTGWVAANAGLSITLPLGSAGGSIQYRSTSVVRSGRDCLLNRCALPLTRPGTGSVRVLLWVSWIP
jgi:hypothetical protein